MANVNDFIHVVKRIIPEEVCEDLIERMGNSKWIKNQWTYKDNQNQVKKVNRDLQNECEMLTNDSADDDVKEDIKFFTDAAIRFYLAYMDREQLKLGIDQPGHNNIVGQCSLPRVNKYKPGTNFKRHIDHIYSVFDGTKRGIPVLSTLGVLNDDYEGGRVFIRDLKLDLKQGDIIVWPSLFIYPHEIETVTKGTRYSFVNWWW
jgi:predicted 2-oxoglutarate/Fe(II)-dependent dioxygenase YbiX